jgi:hypothetical protein
MFFFLQEFNFLLMFFLSKSYFEMYKFYFPVFLAINNVTGVFRKRLK